MDWWNVLFAATAAGAVGFAVGSRRSSATPVAEPAGGAADGAAPSPSAPAAEATPTAAVDNSPRMHLLRLAGPISDSLHSLAHPDDLLPFPAFQACVAALAGPVFTLEDLFGYLVGDNGVLSCAAARALAQRQDLRGQQHLLLDRLAGISNYARHFVLQALATASDPDLPPAVLLRIDQSWSTAMGVDLLRAYLRGRLHAAGAEQSRERLLDRLRQEDGKHFSELLRRVLEPLDDDGARAMLATLGGAGGIDLALLRSCAQVIEPTAASAPRLPVDTQQQALHELRDALRLDPPRSLLLVGEPGVGKHTVLQQLIDELLADGWVVFRAGATELLAGQSFLGQLEQRLQELLRAVGGQRKVLWLAPDLPELAFAGRTLQSRTSILDQVLPHLLSGHLRLVAPLTPAAHEQLLRQAPSLRGGAVTVRLPAASSDATLALARAWLATHQDGAAPLCDHDLLLELHQRALQYLGDQARPGGLLQLLALLQEHVRRGGAPGRAATRDDVIAVLSRLTGLPAPILDDREGLDLDRLRKAFTSRVLGQPEAVDCLVERIAMVKAGLCDPKRPLGVFLFTGPTGTGKTELARALAEYLFGSDDRMLRLDMSEFQHPESVDRLLGDADAVHGRTALVHKIREQPFAIVLLDEIEKAHPMVFDLFLQLFDEGRLTDRRGLTADFRHAIVIATSNVGVRQLDGSGLGFAGNSRTTDMQRALEEVFRREFLNRIDRIVVFRSLDRATLRAVLQKELDQALQRRGLRQRQWAIEWDESALQLLLEHGWSPQLGARPLRRAIERLVLAPLAAAIVTDRLPKGDQFLFARSDGRSIQVEFVDPDAPPEPKEAPPAAPAATPDLRTLAREASGRADEAAALRQQARQLEQVLAEPAWRDRKAAAYAAMGEGDFWSSPRRHAVLGTAELMDRIEGKVRKAVQRADELAARTGSTAAEPQRQFAARLLQLQLAIEALATDTAQEAFLQVVPVHAPHEDGAAARAFAKDLWAMYESWARRCHLDWRALDSDGDRAVVAIGGLAAYPVLQHELGLHVLEPDSAPMRAIRVRVTVAPQPDVPAGPEAEGALALRALAEAARQTPSVVRRYRRSPSPEVRDRRRGWRTGNLDKVLRGDFDLFGP